LKVKDFGQGLLGLALVLKYLKMEIEAQGGAGGYLGPDNLSGIDFFGLLVDGETESHFVTSLQLQLLGNFLHVEVHLSLHPLGNVPEPESNVCLVGIGVGSTMGRGYGKKKFCSPPPSSPHRLGSSFYAAATNADDIVGCGR
jgi:hypothetical protein